MPHYKKMFDSDYIANWDLEIGEEYELTIASVARVEVFDRKQQALVKKACVYFEGRSKGLIFGPEKGAIIAEAYGTDCDDWIGKKLVIFSSTRNMAGNPNHPCIKVRAPK